MQRNGVAVYDSISSRHVVGDAQRLEMDELVRILRLQQVSGQRWQAEVHGRPDGHVTLTLTLFPSLIAPER